MKRDIANKPLKSSFLSFEKDIETIIRELFVTSQPHSDMLKRLLVINTDDCIDDMENEGYKRKLKEMSVAKLRSEGYIKFEPKLPLKEHEEIKSYILISFNNFRPNKTNPRFRDCNVVFDIICGTDYWDIGNYRIRPLKIAGIIDGILDNSKLSGVGEFQFLGCNELVLDEDLAGYSLIFSAIHGSDDWIPGGE